MSRKRFKANRICSSENYEESRRIHLQDLKQNHENHEDELIVIQLSVRVEIKRIPYTRVFGTIIPLLEDEVARIEASLVIWK